MGIEKKIIHGIDLLGDATNDVREEVHPDIPTPAEIPADTSAEATVPAPAETAPTTSEAPATNDTSPAVAVDASDTIATPDNSTPTPAVGTLPADYLRGGYYKGEGQNRYTNPVLVDHAEAIGKALAVGGVTPTAINRMIKTLKDVKKSLLMPSRER